ncbi:methionyl-tRNA formyltransferase [Candidatus Pelagibacter sp.]|uniref:methionyl-tRNA formyltransferase n=1 Tax=Candidatus Pelagibacter sp. TaxID=2024849 RepID=UPI003F866B2D
MLKKIIFMGTPMFSVPILKSLYQNGYPVTCVYTQPPQKSKRGQKVNKSPIQGISETLNIEYRAPETLKDNQEEYEYIKNLQADLAIVVAYGQIIPKNIISLTKKGFINIHASLLPKWRGAAPIQRSIMNLDKETGISIMKIDEELDAGSVSNQYKLEIGDENAEEISEKLSLLAAEKILDEIDDVLDDKANFIEQDHSKATYAPKIAKSEGRINWNEKAEQILGKVNGLYPVPGAWFNFDGERYKILKAKIGNAVGKVGEVSSDQLEIICGDNKSLKIVEIQRQGKRVQSINEFMLGSRIKKGMILPNE